MPKATLLFDYRQILPEGFIVKMQLWEVSAPVPPATHRFKYSLFFGLPDERIIGFDNERGKGDHWHERNQEHPYTFQGPAKLIEDFKAAVRAVSKVRL